MMDKTIQRELDATEKANNLDKMKTAFMKAQFIQEMKTGLGEDIKLNPRGVKIIKKTWNQKLVLFLKKLFTRF